MLVRFVRPLSAALLRRTGRTATFLLATGEERKSISNFTYGQPGTPYRGVSVSVLIRSAVKFLDFLLYRLVRLVRRSLQPDVIAIGADQVGVVHQSSKGTIKRPATCVRVSIADTCFN